MPGSLLWAADVYGKVYSLSTARDDWERCQDVLLELKRLTAGPNVCWGVGCDHHVYLNVLPGHAPIRYQEETYENQRWNPVEGFTDALLPTDRWPWSDVTGMTPQPLHSFSLPSHNWEWEGDWYMDDGCAGDPPATEGWEYAVDFPANFAKEKKWNSCVRRRRWFRYRRYKALGTWAKIPLDDPKRPPVPFCDLSCGGWDMTQEPGGHTFLWAVTQQGEVWFRSGIQDLKPEGLVWEEVPVPREVSQISAGPGDLVWAVLWDGQILVRTGVCWDCPNGSSWMLVDSPSKEAGVVHVSVGVSVVWAVTKDRKVWFRRGINSHNPSGSGWVHMDGEMIMVDVGLNDQVWGISCDDRALYHRQGVSECVLSGRAWTAVSARWGSRPEAAPPSGACVFGGELTGPSQGSVLDCEQDAEPNRTATDLPGVSLGPEDPPTPLSTLVPSDSFISSLVCDRGGALGADVGPPETPPSGPEAVQNQGDTDVPGTLPSTPQTTPTSPAGAQEPPWSTVDLEAAQNLQDPPPQRCPPRLLVATYSLAQEKAHLEEDRPVWASVTGGGCDVTGNTYISWLHTSDACTRSISLSIAPVQSAAWLEQQSERFSKDPSERVASVRVVKGSMCWRSDWRPRRWVDTCVALEQSTDTWGKRDGILFIYYTHNEEKKFLQATIKEVTALVPVLMDSRHAFAVYTAERTNQRWPILLAAQTEQEMTEWLSLLDEACCDSRGIRGPPSPQALWSVTSKGDVMVHEPSASLEGSPRPLPCEQMFWRQVPGHLRCVESNSLGVVWGIGCDGRAWVYTGSLCSETPQMVGGAGGPLTQTDVRCVYIYENQRWNPMTGYTDRGLPTDRFMWSDEEGFKESTKANTKPPSTQWEWVTDWAIDFGIPGGSDKEGWQYAADFPVTFHGHKTMKDFVRRRRWVRKCKITLSGMWQEVPPIPLCDITVLPCLAESRLEQVPVWAVSDKGDVLCRLGVTPQNPGGTSWLHVGTDQPFKSISIGGGHQVWAIARDGSVFYRGSVSIQNPAGECWYHIPSPARQTLRQASVGRTSVYAVDESGNLWYRQGLTPSYPQGSAWELISGNVCKVSVGPLDQVWTVVDKVPGFPSERSGTVCHRLGVQPMQPKGQSWDFGIGGGWEHLSVRGNAKEAPRPSLPCHALPPRPPAPRGSPLPSRLQGQVNGNAVGC